MVSMHLPEMLCFQMLKDYEIVECPSVWPLRLLLAHDRSESIFRVKVAQGAPLVHSWS